MKRRFCIIILVLFTVRWGAPIPAQPAREAATTHDTVTPVSWSLLIEAAAAGGHDSLAVFGVRTDALPEYDPQYDTPCPPAPPGTFVRAYFPHEGGGWPAMLGDKFATDFTSPQTPAWRMVVETNAGPGTVTLAWDTSEVGPLPDTFFLLMEDSAADSLVRLRETGEYTFTYGGPRVLLIRAEFASTIIGIESGWNIVSIPRLVTDSSASSLFPASISPAYDFDTAYHPRESLSPGRAYWLKFPSQTMTAVAGLSVETLDIPVRAGWNMIGVLSRTITPPGPASVVTPFYEYSAGYRPADSLVPGKGYWVKVTGDGILSLGSGGGDIPSTAATADAERSGEPAAAVDPVKVTLRAPGEGNATLLLLPPGAGYHQEDYDLPPAPPAPAFDARFRDGGGAAWLPEGTESLREYAITVQSAGTTVIVSGNPDSAGVTLFAETGPDQWRAITGSSEPVVLTRDSGRSVFRIRAAAAPVHPSGFRLEGNYPNPFNPSTHLRYRLPGAANVTISVADMAGRTVFRSAAVRQEAGPAEFLFDAGRLGLATGIYHYSVSAVAAGSGLRFTGSGKMIFLK